MVKIFEHMFMRFDRIHKSDRQTDGQTDRQTDIARRHRPRLCILHSIAQQSKKYIVWNAGIGPITESL